MKQKFLKDGSTFPLATTLSLLPFVRKLSPPTFSWSSQAFIPTTSPQTTFHANDDLHVTKFNGHCPVLILPEPSAASCSSSSSWLHVGGPGLQILRPLPPFTLASNHILATPSSLITLKTAVTSEKCITKAWTIPMTSKFIYWIACLISPLRCLKGITDSTFIHQKPNPWSSPTPPLSFFHRSPNLTMQAMASF